MPSSTGLVCPPDAASARKRFFFAQKVYCHGVRPPKPLRPRVRKRVHPLALQGLKRGSERPWTLRLLQKCRRYAECRGCRYRFLRGSRPDSMRHARAGRPLHGAVRVIRVGDWCVSIMPANQWRIGEGASWLSRVAITDRRTRQSAGCGIPACHT